MMRQLVSYRLVSEVKPIVDADKIELAVVDGWQCVVKRDQLKVGDRCLYFEIDSFLPIHPEFEFLRKSSFRKMGDEPGFHLRTIKLRKTLSQGLLLPLSNFPDLTGDETSESLQEVLGIKKYEPPIPACISGEVSGGMPSYIRKTDQERIQNLGQHLIDYRDMPFEVTEKLDGTSCTFYLYQGNFGVCGRNWEYRERPGHTFWAIAEDKNLKEKMLGMGRHLALQGEVCGEGIQGNRYKIRGQKFFLFDIFDIDQRRYLLPKERADIGDVLGLDQVPYLGVMHVSPTIDAMLELAGGMSALEPTLREGVVFKSTRLVINDVVSFKAISNDFLLAED